MDKKKRIKPILKNEIEAIQNILEGKDYYRKSYVENLIEALEELKRRMYKWIKKN